MNVNDDDDKGQSAFYARSDAEQRAEAAFAAHKDFFCSNEHLTNVKLAEVVTEGRVKFYDRKFITERVRKGRPCTQVKFDKVTFNSGQRVLLEESLAAYGFDSGDFGYMPKSQSFSIYVY
jgi:hypothetical protein